jgi:hypothetical protein
MKERNGIEPATLGELLEAQRELEARPRYRRMKELHAKEAAEGLSPEESEELRRIVEPKFREGDVMQEFMRDLEAAKAKDRGPEPE